MLTRPIFVRVARRPSAPKPAKPKRAKRSGERAFDVSRHPIALLVRGATRF